MLHDNPSHRMVERRSYARHHKGELSPFFTTHDTLGSCLRKYQYCKSKASCGVKKAGGVRNRDPSHKKNCSECEHLNQNCIKSAKLYASESIKNCAIKFTKCKRGCKFGTEHCYLGCNRNNKICNAEIHNPNGRFHD